jgi:hypothetical protein
MLHLLHPIRHRNRLDMTTFSDGINDRPVFLAPLQVLYVPMHQLPSRTPSCFTPLTRRMPAASSGLNKPASAASYANGVSR